MLHTKAFIFFKESKLIVFCDLNRLANKATIQQLYNREDAKDARVRRRRQRENIDIYHVKKFSQKILQKKIKLKNCITVDMTASLGHASFFCDHAEGKRFQVDRMPVRFPAHPEPIPTACSVPEM